LDVSEINLFNLKNKLNEFKKNIKTVTKITYVLMNLGNYQNVKKLFLNTHFTSVFHTAAYKHVSIVEENKVEAFKNNVTHFINLLKLSIKNNIKNFTLISSDKAVKPKNFMGLTKKICEEILIYYSLKGSSLDKSNFKVVRFGNVFNSSGSVVPIFKDQIKSGGPLTITSRNSTRFFMSIPEAVKLILSTQALPNNYGIFIFEMGRAIPIIEIAKKLIFLNSLSSNSFIGHNEIEIKEIGLRDGEKEHEILSDGEIIKTQNNNIYEVIEERYTEDLIKKILNINNDFYNNNSQEECINKITQLLS
jgi:FlaA1/EpsC-like NDP-sugar epimerase